jgi:serine/threonine protein kinase
MESYAFQNYKILNLIGEGSFGKVFKAAENDTKNVVALKILIKVRFIFQAKIKNKINLFFFSEGDRQKNCRLSNKKQIFIKS